MRFSIFIVLSFCASQLFASPFTVNYQSYGEAKKGDQFVMFQMESTKMGLITTDFEGYIKSFTFSGSIENEKVSLAELSFKGVDMDTGVSGRNAKMWETCLETDKYPNIVIRIIEPIDLTMEQQTLAAQIQLRGSDNQIQLQVKTSRTDSEIVFKITGELSIKGLGIPDPSILVAKVNDKIMVRANLKAVIGN